MSSFISKKSLIFSFVLFFNSFIFVYSSLNVKQIELFSKILYKETLGFKELYNSNALGKWFEMESALWMQNSMQQDIIMFDVTIEVVSINCPDKKVPCINDFFELKSTEFDVLTGQFAIECKALTNPVLDTSLEQILKEKRVLEWLFLVNQEYEKRQLDIDIFLSHKNNSPLLKICGESTFGKEIILGSNFFNFFEKNKIEEKDLKKFYIDLWFNLISNLANKSFKVLFKNSIKDSELEKNFKEENIDFMENIKIESLSPNLNLKILEKLRAG